MASTPSSSEMRAHISAQVTVLQDKLDSQHLVRYLSQSPPIFGTVHPDEIEILAGEKLNKGATRSASPEAGRVIKSNSDVYGR
jgi:hypothetical protein